MHKISWTLPDIGEIHQVVRADEVDEKTAAVRALGFEPRVKEMPQGS